MREVVICEPVRTPIGRYGGALASLTAVDLAVRTLRALIERVELPAEAVDDVILGHCYPSSEAPAIGRVVALDADLPVEVCGLQVDRRCGSGLQAIIMATMQAASGASDVIIAGGTESMSNVPYYSTDLRFGPRRRTVQIVDALVRGRETAGGRSHPVPGGMVETAENLRRDYSISRVEQDEYAQRSHARAVAAQRDGRFDAEIVPVTVDGQKDRLVIDRDEHPRADTTVEKLAALKPMRLGVDAEATVTAGNASGQNDAAALCVVTTRAKAAELGLQPLVRLVSWSTAGVQPSRMGIGPVPAVAKTLARAGLAMTDMDLIELNEAFAAQVLACTREWQFGPADFERMNVLGSGISLGHPVGATGARILCTLAREMGRRGARYGLESMCIGGGQGLAAIFELAI